MSAAEPTGQAIIASSPYDMAAQAAYANGAGASQEGGGVLDAVRVLKQRLLLIFLTFLLLYSAVAGGTLAVRRWFPLYASEGFMELEPQRRLSDPEETPMTPEVMKNQLMTEARKLKNYTLLQDVLKLPEIKQTSFYAYYEGDVARATYDLQKLLVAAPVQDTNLIRVALAIRDKTEAKEIVNAVLTRYEQLYTDQSQSQLVVQLQGYKDAVAATEARLAAKRDEITRHREQADISALEEGRDTSSQMIGQLQNELIQVELAIAQVEASLNSIRNRAPDELPVNAEMRLIVESDPVLRFFRSSVENLDVQLRTTGLDLGKGHRSMRQLQEQRNALYEKEVGRREELINDIRERQIESQRENLESYRAVQLRLVSQLQDASATQRDLDRKIQRFRQLEDDKDLLIEELKRIGTMASVVEQATKDRSRAQRLSIVQFAEEAIKPSRPSFVLYLGGGFVLSLAGAIGLAFLREFTDKAIRTPLDVARFGHLSVLGNIPMIDDEQADIDDIELAVRKAPHSLVAEAFRQVRTNLLFSGPLESQRALLITSPGPGDGKSAVAINLATTLAFSNQRVLLIDCNFRRPALQEAFQSARREGLSNLLIGQGALDQFVVHTDVSNLHVLTSGPMPPNPAELLGSVYMQQLIAEAKSRYDRVILDGPPALLISDAMVLATQVDGVILVTRAVSNSKGALKRTREQLERINAHVIGAVLNGVQASSGGYFRQQYRDFYEYASDETIPPELPEPRGDPKKANPFDEDDAARR